MPIYDLYFAIVVRVHAYRSAERSCAPEFRLAAIPDPLTGPVLSRTAVQPLPTVS